MRDLADLARNLIKGLFDTYRPELHYMRGPGPKWHAKHEGTPRPGPGVAALMPVAPGHARVLLHSSMPSLAPLARQSIGRHNFVQRGASLTLGIGLFVIALLVSSPTASKADASYCAQASDLAAARLRWAAARQAASICEDGIDRQRDLDLLDFEINAFNQLIAAQCGG